MYLTFVNTLKCIFNMNVGNKNMTKTMDSAEKVPIERTFTFLIGTFNNK